MQPSFGVKKLEKFEETGFEELRETTASECVENAKTQFRRYDELIDSAGERGIYALGIAHAAVVVFGTQALIDSDLTNSRALVASIVFVSSLGFLCALMARVLTIAGFVSYKSNLLDIVRQNSRLIKQYGQDYPSHVSKTSSVHKLQILIGFFVAASFLCIVVLTLVIAAGIWFIA